METSTVIAVLESGQMAPINASANKVAEITAHLAEHGPVIIEQEGGKELEPIIALVSIAQGHTIRSSVDKTEGVVFLVYGEEANVDAFTSK